LTKHAIVDSCYDKCNKNIFLLNSDGFGDDDHYKTILELCEKELCIFEIFLLKNWICLCVYVLNVFFSKDKGIEEEV
jgi:hypothetical protein